MNHNDSKHVIALMIASTHDAHDIQICVNYETISIRATAEHMDDLTISWTYKGYGNERVRQISKEYSRDLMMAQLDQGR